MDDKSLSTWTIVENPGQIADVRPSGTKFRGKLAKWNPFEAKDTTPYGYVGAYFEEGGQSSNMIHVSGESLMNDGSAVVFYNIFSARFLYEMGIPEVGKDIGWGEGFLTFFTLAFGGGAIGVAFGLGLLLVLYKLNRRLSGEDAVVQVVATITTAYLTFFTSEILAGCSGIIAVLFCGVTVKAGGETLYSDAHLSHHFWEITEYLLNTLLFALGGCVWGDIISGGANGELLFGWSDWGYLLLLYVFLTLIRFFLVFAFYPLTSRIGIGTNWREAVFMSYGGLRGTVGVALAMSLHAKVDHFTDAVDAGDEFRENTAKVFGMVGGVALLTLVINGPTAGPLLRRLGLVTPTETRKKVIENYRQHMTHNCLLDYVSLLTDKRFQDVDFTVVKDHVPFLRKLTHVQLMAAVKKHADMSPAASYKKPQLKNVLPYLKRFDVAGDSDDDDTISRASHADRRNSVAATAKCRRSALRSARSSVELRSTVFDYDAKVEGMESVVKEERLVFIKILRFSYHHLIENGELEPRGFIAKSLLGSLGTTEDAASKGLPMNDWTAVHHRSECFAKPVVNMVRAFSKLGQLMRSKGKEDHQSYDLDFVGVELKIRQILAFNQAHHRARKVFKEEFSKAGMNELTEAEKIVLDECDLQVQLAYDALEKMPAEDVSVVKSHYVCQILLNKSAHYMTKLKERGLMTEREVGEVLEEIEEHILHVSQYRKEKHTDELTPECKQKRLLLVSPEWRIFVHDSPNSTQYQALNEIPEGIEVEQS